MTMPSLSNPATNPLGVALYVEMRKLFDTRSARWLLLFMGISGILAVGLVIVLSIMRHEPLNLSALLVVLALPAGFGTPIIAILSITSDWQHKDVIKFFTLQPRRGVILGAKYLAVGLFALAIMLLASCLALLTVLAISAATGSELIYGEIGANLWLVFCTTTVGAVSGAAVGSAILSTPLAIIFVLFQSFVFDALIGLVAEKATPYLQSGSFAKFLTEGGDILPAITSCTIWIVIPASIGIWRNLKSDI
ncbi:hypothetical protein [Sinomonas sp. ASV322]|uniref:hypothetical protein n=1 Tax=Sinomonas sp. ASV322 TaxID=3041920 RepID=UPI0027DD9E9F|nr:hypothetical protein [Sinomonas sp. ASV322]MDQ4502376.1 hypothetical protein [Sinomonas sp. ASV322]